MAKVFEGEVSTAIRAITAYSHKCPDHPHAIPDKVDFLCSISGVFYGIEAKEVTNQAAVPMEIVTPNQRAVLDRIEQSGGRGYLLVNFDRKRGVRGHVGHCVAFRWCDFRDQSVLRLEDGRLCGRLAGTWDLRWMRIE